MVCDRSGGACAGERRTERAERSRLTVVERDYTQRVVDVLNAMPDDEWRGAYSDAVASGELEPLPDRPDPLPLTTDPNAILLERYEYRRRVLNFGAHDEIIRPERRANDPNNRVTETMLTRRESWTPGGKPSSSKKGRTRTKPMKAADPNLYVGHGVAPQPKNAIKIVDLTLGERAYYDKNPGVASAVLSDLAQRIRMGERPGFLLSPIKCLGSRSHARNGMNVYVTEYEKELVSIFRGAAKRALVMHAWREAEAYIRDVDMSHGVRYAAA